MLSKAWPDVAGYTYAETSRGAGRQNPDFKASVFRIPLATQERLNDQVQARVYLARRLYADAESARQNADQGIRQVSDAGAASAVGLRRLLDHAGRRPQLRLRAEAGRRLSGRRAGKRPTKSGWRST